jgi:hypothetical protein
VTLHSICIDGNNTFPCSWHGWPGNNPATSIALSGGVTLVTLTQQQENLRRRSCDKPIERQGCRSNQHRAAMMPLSEQEMTMFNFKSNDQHAVDHDAAAVLTDTQLELVAGGLDAMGNMPTCPPLPTLFRPSQGGGPVYQGPIK